MTKSVAALTDTTSAIAYHPLLVADPRRRTTDIDRTPRVPPAERLAQTCAWFVRVMAGPVAARAWREESAE